MPLPYTGTKARIIEEAVHLFALHGFAAVPVRDIARAVGIKDASIYSHFASKDELLDIIIDHFRAAFWSSIPPVEKLEWILARCPPWAFLVQGFSLFKQRVEDPVMAWTYQVLMREKFSNNRAAEAWAAHRENVIGYVETAFRVMVTKELIPARDPRGLACLYEYPMLLLLENYITELCNGRPTQAIEDEIFRHKRFFFELLTGSAPDAEMEAQNGKNQTIG